MTAGVDRFCTVSWRKSKASQAGDACVEVGRIGDSVLVRNSRDRSQQVLTFTRVEWQALLVLIRNE
jgi:hypothetical protein